MYVDLICVTVQDEYTRKFTDAHWPCYQERRGKALSPSSRHKVLCRAQRVVNWLLVYGMLCGCMSVYFLSHVGTLEILPIFLTVTAQSATYTTTKRKDSWKLRVCDRVSTVFKTSCVYSIAVVRGSEIPQSFPTCFTARGKQPTLKIWADALTLLSHLLLHHYHHHFPPLKSLPIQVICLSFSWSSSAFSSTSQTVCHHRH